MVQLRYFQCARMSCFFWQMHVWAFGAHSDVLMMCCGVDHGGCVDVLMYVCTVIECWCVDVLMCWCVDVFMSWCVDVLMCWCVDVFMFRCWWCIEHVLMYWCVCVSAQLVALKYLSLSGNSFSWSWSCFFLLNPAKLSTDTTKIRCIPKRELIFGKSSRFEFFSRLGPHLCSLLKVNISVSDQLKTIKIHHLHQISQIINKRRKTHTDQEVFQESIIPLARTESANWWGSGTSHFSSPDRPFLDYSTTHFTEKYRRIFWKWIIK